MGFVKGCALLHSGLREKLFVSLTPSKHVKGVHAKLETDGAHCNPQQLATMALPSEFSTTVAYFAHAPSPSPETASCFDFVHELSGSFWWKVNNICKMSSVELS